MPDADRLGGGRLGGGRLGGRLERLPAVQIAGSVLMMVFVAFLILWNLPAGRPRQDVGPVVNPVVQALGMEQNWQLFAPQPRDQTLSLLAVITFADGRTATEAPPRGGVVLAPYRDYRWQKLVESICFDRNQPLLASAARWFARQAGPGARVVQLSCTSQPVQPPGSAGPPPLPTVQYPYTLVVR